MLNAEKFKKEILDITEGGYYFAVSKDRQNIARSCDGLKCENCIFDEEDDRDCGCNFSRMKWMLSECKGSLKVSKLEFDILLYLYHNTKFRYIARDEGMWLFAYYESPVKCTDNWQGGKCYETLDIFSNLFKFVKWSDDKPTSIKDVLDNCEVIENDTK